MGLVGIAIGLILATQIGALAGYIDNGNGTVTDTSTGLMWQKETPDDAKTWEQALSYCENLTLGGHTDWRLPTIKELRSLVDYTRYNPAINTTYFPDTVASDYWSSTTYADGPDYAWIVYFYGGYDVSYGKSYDGYVRAVRGGQGGGLGYLVISPTSQSVAKDAGTTTFSVSNTGTGTMPWTAAVTSGGSWLRITSGASGTDSGTITCGYDANTGTDSRTGTIRVTASGASGSPVDVTVTQAVSGTGDCISDWLSQNPAQGSISGQELSDINCLFDWLETNVPDICYPPTTTTALGFFAYRSYASTSAYLLAWKTATLKLVYLGPLSNGCPLELGDVETLKQMICNNSSQGITSGLWSGSNIKFNVSSDGTQISSTGSSITYNGKAYSMALGPSEAYVGRGLQKAGQIDIVR
jgi:hypothetical protein